MIKMWRYPRSVLLRRMEIERRMIEAGYKISENTEGECE